ncbi:MAG: hypothetical protein U1F57_03900 [bacterium]
MATEDKLHRIYLSKRSIDNWLKREVMAKDNFSCHYCSAPLSSPLIAHIDHDARSQGRLTDNGESSGFLSNVIRRRGEDGGGVFLSMNVREGFEEDGGEVSGK